MNNLHDTPLSDFVHATCNITVFDVMKPYEYRRADSAIKKYANQKRLFENIVLNA